MNNPTELFYDNFKYYNSITDKLIFDKYLKSGYEKSFFYLPLLLITIGLITNIFYFKTLLFYGNILVFILLILVYMFKTEKMIHHNISEIISDYSKDIANNYVKFDRKYLRFLHFNHIRSSKLSLNDIENMLEIVDVKAQNKSFNFLNSIIFTMIFSLFLSQLASTFGSYTTAEGMIGFIYFVSTLLYFRYVIFTTYTSKAQKLLEFKGFLIDMKHLKANKT